MATEKEKQTGDNAARLGLTLFFFSATLLMIPTACLPGLVAGLYMAFHVLYNIY